jgi:hypothetical protein
MPRGTDMLSRIGTASDVQTTAGSTQADAALLVADHAYVPVVGAGEGIILDPMVPGDEFTVVNGDAAESLSVYPPVGSAFNGAATNAALVLPANSAAIFKCVTAAKIAAIYS